MSTTVDNSRKKPRLSAQESRDRILAAAGIAFTRAGYDAIGVREIAAAAGVDAAMVPRLFGSKEALFAIIANDAFGLEPAFAGPIGELGERIARHLAQPMMAAESDRFDEFAFLLRSLGSPTAAPILSAALHAHFIKPLSKHMSGRAAEARAALATAYVLGFAVLRVGLGSPALEAAKPEPLIARLGEALQACFAP